MIISINFNENLAYGAKELALFLRKCTNEIILENSDGAERVITLKVDANKQAHHYEISGDGTQLSVVGGNESSVLCGIYEALADAGIFFEATGYSLPHAFNLDLLFKINKKVEPKFRLRGIRQHINFPMDVSSYTLEEAKEYIRCIARMRYNAITFHSYPGQWHEVNSAGEKDFAGHFFYGKTYPVPQEDALTASRVNNETIYCIPEAEPVFHKEYERGEFAKAWLNELMKTAKEAGLTITMSVEITFDGDEAIVSMLRKVGENYPLIDTLELISEECGGFRDMPELNMDNIKAFMVNTFDKDVLDEEGNLPGLPDFVPHQLGAAAISVRRVLHALSLRDAWLTSFNNNVKLRGGIYTTCPDTLRILRRILRDRLPQGMTFSLLPAHGAVAVVDNIRDTGTIEEDWQNTMFYSWAEFDGNMFIQQMSTDGIEQLVSMPTAESAYGFCINHWRTAENNLAISYAAEAAISGQSAREFYADYAKTIGVCDVASFVEVCTKLAGLDTYNRDNLFNIGFCAVGCWLNWCRRGDAIIPRGFPADLQTTSIEKYEEIIADLEKLLGSAYKKEGMAFIKLMINRCQTSILHIKSLMALDKLFDLYDYSNPQPISEEQSKQIHEAIATARNYAIEYLHLYGENLPDRGGEGQLVSYYETTVVFIDAVAANFSDNKKVIATDDYDAPPMPDAEVK